MSATKKKLATKRKKTTAKKVVKKTSKKKPIKPKVKPTKAVKAKPAKKPAAKPAKVKKQKETVSLPTNTGPRLQSKAEALHELLDRFHVPMKQISYVSAAAFILVGILTIGSEYLPPVSKQLAQTCNSVECDPNGDGQYDPATTDSDENDNAAGSDTTNHADETGAPSQPVIDFFDPVPPFLEESVQLSFAVLHSSAVYGELLDLNTGDQLDLQVSKLSEENYQIVLHEDYFETGEYQVVIVAYSEDEQTMVEYEAGIFAVRRDNLVTDETSTTTDTQTEVVDTETGTTTAQTGTADSTDPGSDGAAETSPETNHENDINDNPNGEDQDETGEPSLESGVDSGEDETTVAGENESLSDTPEFELIVNNRHLEKRAAINVSAPADYRNVELYARPVAALQSIFLGRMYEVSDYWLYDFDTNNLPNGEYELFALANFDGRSVTTASKGVEVRNVVDYTINQQPHNSAEEVDEPEVQNDIEREFYEFTEPESETEPLIESEVEKIVGDIIDDNKKDLNDLLQRYAVAVQTNDPVILDAVRKEIDETREGMVGGVIEDEGSENVAQIDIKLIERLDDMKGRVDTFESIRQSRSQKNVNEDTDGDGISDYDEINVYETDPASADSDKDGFIDGVEIARGYDPTRNEPEAVVDFELPTEVIGLVRSDVLEVVNVKPVITTSENNNPILDSAEITGTGLPNSYVTLYIFSSPVIVTVKTNDDGSFVYRFDKELEDGEHEVFVAFTDNTGDILAHSEPFQFVKRAQAFTPVDAAQTEVVEAAPSIVETSTTSTLKIVLGMSVLVLGFILMMFGVHLRQTEPELAQIIEDNAIKTT